MACSEGSKTCVKCVVRKIDAAVELLIQKRYQEAIESLDHLADTLDMLVDNGGSL